MPRTKKHVEWKPVTQMTPEEQRAEMEKLRSEQAVIEQRKQHLRETGFYEWADTDAHTGNHGDTWIAAYQKGFNDAFEARLSETPEFESVRNSLNALNEHIKKNLLAE